MDQQLIRNFCIIAHIDHGKSTLADRLLEVTNTVHKRDMEEQLLDQMDLEREKGITIKAQAVRMAYTADDGKTYELNLIDTPGHVDFSYEVSRSLAACEGAILVVDATQGIEAQTLANVYLAYGLDLTIVPVINKVDLPSAEPERVRDEMQRVIGIDGDDVVLISAKSGLGVHDVLEAVVRMVPPPSGDPEAEVRALIFDSKYDSYRGVIAYVRMMHGTLRTGDRILLLGSGAESELMDLGSFRPMLTPLPELSAGEVGYIATGFKNVKDCQVGDTITNADRPAAEPLPGYKPAQPMVFAGLYPINGEDYPLLRDALDRLQLNDASLTYEPESSVALGFGYRCGFLGLLHLEIIQQRLEREYKLELLTTAPSVEYQVTRTDGTMLTIDNPAHLPTPDQIESIAEPWVKAGIFTPTTYIGAIMELCQTHRGTFVHMSYIDELRVQLDYDVPLSELIIDFYDQLKSRSQGYASLDYEITGYREGKLVKLDILVNAVPVDALSLITHQDKAYSQGRQLVDKLRGIIPRQLFEVPIQAAIGSKVIARETVRAMRKDVLAKCYGGDVSRKRKLLEKQKEGKARMKRVGNVEIPQEAFMAVLSLNSGSSD
jgi:GTP-binding protein LepA